MSLRKVAISALFCAVAVFAPAQQVENPRFRALDDIITSAIQAKVFPGAVLIVGRPEGVFWMKPYGAHTYEPGAKPMTIDTLFDLASVSKVVGTTACAMALIEAGKLGLDDSVSRYVPAFSGNPGIKIRHLLTHISGLPAYTATKKAEAGRKPGQTSADALIDHIGTLATTSTAGKASRYSCLNMLTMARVNENVLRERMDDYLTTRVFGPLGMSDTVYRLSDEQKQRCAPTAKTASGGWNNGEIHDPLANYHTSADHCPGNAGLFSTAVDLARYCTMILNQGRVPNGAIFQPQTVADMTSNEVPPEIKEKRGFGWDLFVSPWYSTPDNQTDANGIAGHTGYTGTFIWVDKKSRTYIVLLANRTIPNGANPEDGRIIQVRKQVCAEVLGLLPEYESFRGKIENWK